MAAFSGAVKPLAFRPITVLGFCPLLNASIAAVSSPAPRPRSRGTGVLALAPTGWHPEQEAAPGGGSALAAAPGVSNKPATTSTRVRDMGDKRARQRRQRAATTELLLGRLHQVDLLVLERQGTDALAGRRKVGVEHGGSRHADRRLAHASPRIVAAGGHDDRFHLRHLGDAHRIV